MNYDKMITAEMVAACNPCYEDFADKYGSEARLMSTILQDSRIPPQDRLWLFTRKGLMDDKILRLFACACVRETKLEDGRTVWDLLTDERSKNAVIVSEKYAKGEATKEELDAAWDAARAAARDAAWGAAGVAAWGAAWGAAGVAAWAAARDAARGATWDAAWGAARAAARAAAWVAAGDAAGDAAREQQCQIALRLILTEES